MLCYLFLLKTKDPNSHTLNKCYNLRSNLTGVALGRGGYFQNCVQLLHPPFKMVAISIPICIHFLLKNTGMKLQKELFFIIIFFLLSKSNFKHWKIKTKIVHPHVSVTARATINLLAHSTVFISFNV
jgi:hypothetical protein